jgi:hypothetical protein
MKEIILMMYLMGRGNISGLMETSMMDNGTKDSFMGRVRKVK